MATLYTVDDFIDCSVCRANAFIKKTLMESKTDFTQQFLCVSVCLSVYMCECPSVAIYCKIFLSPYSKAIKKIESSYLIY